MTHPAGLDGKDWRHHVMDAAGDSHRTSGSTERAASLQTRVAGSQRIKQTFTPITPAPVNIEGKEQIQPQEDVWNSCHSYFIHNNSKRMETIRVPVIRRMSEWDASVKRNELLTRKYSDESQNQCVEQRKKTRPARYSTAHRVATLTWRSTTGKTKSRWQKQGQCLPRRSQD